MSTLRWSGVNGRDEGDVEREEGLAFKGGFWERRGLTHNLPREKERTVQQVWFAAKL